MAVPYCDNCYSPPGSCLCYNRCRCGQFIDLEEYACPQCGPDDDPDDDFDSDLEPIEDGSCGDPSVDDDDSDLDDSDVPHKVGGDPSKEPTDTEPTVADPVGEPVG